MSKLFLLLFAGATFLLQTGCSPLALDLSSYYNEKYDLPASGVTSASNITGKREFDGLPFFVNGSCRLYGKTMAENKKDCPDLTGIKVGRSFDELHLMHTTKWPDVEGETIALARFHYSDGSTKDLEIGYGVHVRDWQRLQSEEREALKDPLSKVVWRGKGMEKFQSSQRMFKSTLINPKKWTRVDHIDFLSNGKSASYCLHAATVANASSLRPISEPVAQDRPELNFDGKIFVRVVDPEGNPIKDSCIHTSLSIPNTGWMTAGALVYTSAKGICVVKYPKARTDQVRLYVYTTGWKNEYATIFTRDHEQNAKGEITIRLSKGD